MKSSLFAMTFLLLTALCSCGGVGNAEDDAKKLCACMKAAEIDASKTEECATMSIKMEEKYAGNSTAIGVLTQKTNECLGQSN